MAINDRVDNLVSMLRDPEEDLSDAMAEYIWSYYRVNSDGVELDPSVIKAMRALFEGLSFGYGVDQADELIVKTERAINRHGGVLAEDGNRHKVDSLPGYELDEEDEDAL